MDVTKSGKFFENRYKMSTANNIETLRNSVNEAASRVRGLWFGYVALLAYLFIAVAAVTHVDLLLENPVKLPVLNVELPLNGFFVAAPVFFLINHFFLLVQLAGLGQRVSRYNGEIAASGLVKRERLIERSKLDTFVMVQMLGGERENGDWQTGWLLNAIAIITLVVGPVGLLLAIQLQFLPYHHEMVTWVHRLAIGVDLAMLCIFWPPTMRGRWVPVGMVPVSALFAFLVFLISCTIITFPGEFADRGWVGRDWRKSEDSLFPLTKSLLFRDFAREINQKWFSPFSRSLELTGKTNLIDVDTLHKVMERYREEGVNSKFWQSGRTLDLRGRNLIGADFARSDLRNIDLQSARLQGASLAYARLQGASLQFAKLQGASLQGTQLQDASLERARLQGAYVVATNLRGASLVGADLRGTPIAFARLQGASLESARLEGVVFSYVSLQGASLEDAWLQGASFDGSKLQGASLRGAWLQGASFRFASLQGASLEGARLQGASLEGANLQGASLRFAKLQGASLDGAKLQGAALSSASLQDASMKNISWWRAYGLPATRKLQGVWVQQPIFQELTKEQFAKLETEALEGIDDEDLKKHISKSLSRLSINKVAINPPSLNREFWSNLEKRSVSAAVYKASLANRLTKLVCEPPKGVWYNRKEHWRVAQGLTRGLRSRIEALDLDNLRAMARFLLHAIEGKVESCPGILGLDEGYVARLRHWADLLSGRAQTLR